MIVSSQTAKAPATQQVTRTVAPVAQDGVPASPADKAGFSDEVQENPYADLADYSAEVAVEKWSSDRTPAEGLVARNDHLEGMLRNQGFSQEDIYRTDAQGMSMIDRVAEVNGLQDPDLLQPDQSLILPSMQPPPELAEGQSAWQSMFASEAVGEDAQASTTVAELSDASATTRAEALGSDGRANAQTQVSQAIHSEVITEASGHTAEARSDVDQAIHSTVTTGADAHGNDARADARTVVGDSQASTLVSQAQAAGEGSQALALTQVGQADAASELVAEAVSDGGTATAAVFQGGPEAAGHAQVSAAGTWGALAQAQNVESADLTAATENGLALTVSDATSGSAEVSGPAAAVQTEGQGNRQRVSIQGEMAAVVEDRGEGNFHYGEAEAQQFYLDTKTSAGIDVNYTGLPGANWVQGSLPDAPSETSRLGLDLGGGNDTLSLSGRGDLEVEKSDGVLNLYTRLDSVPGETSQLTIQAGEAVVQGDSVGGAGTDITRIQGGRFADEIHDLGVTFDGGAGSEDSFELELPPGAPPTALLTQLPRNGLFRDRPALGAIPQGWQPGDPYIYVPNYEHLAIRQDGRLVAQ